MLKSKHFQNAGRNLKTVDVAILGDVIVEDAKKRGLGAIGSCCELFHK